MKKICQDDCPLWILEEEVISQWSDAKCDEWLAERPLASTEDFNNLMKKYGFASLEDQIRACTCGGRKNAYKIVTELISSDPDCPKNVAMSVARNKLNMGQRFEFNRDFDQFMKGFTFESWKKDKFAIDAVFSKHGYPTFTQQIQMCTCRQLERFKEDVEREC